MSTDLFGVRVRENDGGTLLLDVFITYSHEPAVPTSRTFFLMLLLDRAPEGSPLAVRFPRGRRDEVTLGCAAEEIVLEATALEHHEGLHDFTGVAGAPAAPERAPGERHARQPPLWLHHHQPELNGGAGGWAHEEHLPRATVFVRVSDPRFAEHLAPGMSWGTTAYEP